MGLFSKKKEEVQPLKPQETFTEWEKEMGFLFTKMQRKKNIIKSFFIDIYDTQLVKDTDYIRDEDITEQIEKSVYEVFTEIGGRYRQHLVDKYFGSDAELIKFITEDFYVDLTSAAVNKNNTKIRMKAVFNKLNDFRQEEQEEQKDNKKE
jgi:hypothetical protein